MNGSGPDVAISGNWAGFLYVELSAELQEGKPVEVLRVGEFVDRHGKDVEIREEDLDAFVANFEAGAAGQEVPVDIQHERSEAGGWVRRLWRDGQRLLASVDWNELGQRLVREKIYRYVSATIDLGGKVIKSISLVNFPAVKGLVPVELGEGVYGLEVERGLVRRIVDAVVKEVLGIRDWVLSEELVEFVIRKEGNEIVLYSADGEKVLGRFPFGEGEKYTDEEAARKAAEEREKEIQAIKHSEREGGENEVSDIRDLTLGSSSDETSEQEDRMDEKQVEELRAQIRADIEAELAEKEQTLTELREQVRGEVEAELQERFERKQKLVEFAESVCGGEAGLSVKPGELVEALEAIPTEAQPRVMEMLKAKVVDFTEHGSSAAGKGAKKKLPAEVASHLREFLASDGTVAEFFEANEDVLGEKDQYDLEEFEE